MNAPKTPQLLLKNKKSEIYQSNNNIKKYLLMFGDFKNINNAKSILGVSRANEVYETLLQGWNEFVVAENKIRMKKYKQDLKIYNEEKVKKLLEEVNKKAKSFKNIIKNKAEVIVNNEKIDVEVIINVEEINNNVEVIDMYYPIFTFEEERFRKGIYGNKYIFLDIENVINISYGNNSITDIIFEKFKFSDYNKCITQFIFECNTFKYPFLTENYYDNLQKEEKFKTYIKSMCNFKYKINSDINKNRNIQFITKSDIIKLIPSYKKKIIEKINNI